MLLLVSNGKYIQPSFLIQPPLHLSLISSHFSLTLDLPHILPFLAFPPPALRAFAF